MRAPLRDRGLGAAHRPFASPDIASMPEGEIDGVRQCPIPEHNKRARRAVGLSRRRCDRSHSDTDPEATPGTESSGASVGAATPSPQRQLDRRRRCPSRLLAAEFHEPLSRIPISLANQFEVVLRLA